jgi:hypothetical protein
VQDTDGRAPAPRRTSVERVIEPLPGSAGRRFARSALERERSIEAYLKAGNRPRWMERVMEVDRGIEHHKRRLAAAHRALQEECAGDAAEFARRWRATLAAWPFAELNVLIEQHNAWYPIERDLPMDPRTRDYVPIHGRSFRRPVLSVEWALQQFPAELGGDAAA